jgi:uncharacterized protein with HEPN domain
VIAFVEKAGSLESFRRDALLHKATVMSLLNIGELANHLPGCFTEAHPKIPWKAMIGMRNLAAHGYHVMNFDIVWATAQTSVPELLEFLQSQLNDQ